MTVAEISETELDRIKAAYFNSGWKAGLAQLIPAGDVLRERLRWHSHRVAADSDERAMDDKAIRSWQDAKNVKGA